MGFRKGSYATVWEVSSISQTMTKARVSISRKNKNTDQYEQDFGDFIVFVGSAAASKALKLKPRDRIRLGDVDVSNRFDRDKHVTYYDFKVFEFDYANDAGQSAPQSAAPRSAPAAYNDAVMLDDDDVPF